MSHNEYIIARIEGARVARGISVVELARRSDIDERRLWYILKKNRPLRADELVRLCIVFNIGLRQLMPAGMVSKLEVVRRKIIDEYGTGTA